MEERAQVAAVKCTDYSQENLRPAMERALGLIGFFQGRIKPGMSVLVKPNLLTMRKPEDGVTTHPEFVRCVVRILKERGLIVRIGDSPSGDGRNIEKIYQTSGIKRVADEEGAELLKFDMAKEIKGIPIAKAVLDADLFISLPKFKTHGITILTAGIKNVFGAVSGLSKSELHGRFPKSEEFVHELAKIYGHCKPHLTILDGIVCMEGAGPANGQLREANLILASEDGVALDSILAQSIGIDPMKLPMIKEAAAIDAGVADPERIDLLGEEMGNIKLRGFKLPRIHLTDILPHFFLRLLLKLVKFRIELVDDKCCRCKLCEGNCPVKAIDIDGGLKVNKQRCTLCLCCYEICPYGAVNLKKSLLAKLLWG
ncbi:MAG: DUF362 domain-containing protein [Candidatus Omnitrophica bacterium]|nr:DUF362 domain-containing protein [Candidatus Omnitrophota bacterium]